MKQENIRIPLHQLGRWFVTIRALEMAWILLVFIIASGVVHLWPKQVGETWSLRDAVGTGAIMLVWYYIGFQYLLTSVVVTMVVWFTRLLNTARGFTLLNLLTFVIHSLIVMLVILPGKITPTISAVWLLAVMFNGAVPSRVMGWNRTRKAINVG